MTEESQTSSVLQGMTITYPPGWRDKSMLVLSEDSPGSTGVSANLVITREPMPADWPSDQAIRLENFVEQQLGQMRGALPHLVEVSRRHVGATVELRIEWISDGVPLAQWITYVPTEGDTIIIATATAGHNEFADAEPSFRSMLQSFRST